MSEQNPTDAEFGAMHAVYKALEPLDDDARSRVFTYIMARFEIAVGVAAIPKEANNAENGISQEGAVTGKDEEEAPKYGSLAELYDASQPKGNSDKALVAGYWLQVCQGAENFDAMSANKELKNLGQGLPNITNAIDALKNQKPALALQLKKSGKSQQARKTYKITVAGIKAVEAMING